MRYNSSQYFNHIHSCFLQYCSSCACFLAKTSYPSTDSMEKTSKDDSSNVIRFVSLSFFDFPYMFIKLLTLCGVPSSVLSVYSSYATFFHYYTILLFPFVCIVSLPELQAKIKKLFHCRRKRQVVGPKILGMARVAI